MKYIGSVIPVLISIFFLSCQSEYTKNKTILQAETVVLTFPDSAFRLLKTIPHPENLSKADYAAWCLQFSHVQYKLNQDITSDRIIQVAVNYYENSRLDKQSGTAYYLLGCILQKNNEYKEAMIAYKKAEYILKSTENRDLKGLVDFKIGYLYMLEETFNESLIYFKKILKLFYQHKKFQIPGVCLPRNFRYLLSVKLSLPESDEFVKSGIKTFKTIGRFAQLLFDIRAAGRNVI